MAKKRKRAESYRCQRYGILNHLGGIWTPHTFVCEQDGMNYIYSQQAKYPNMKLGRHRVVPVRVTVSVLR